LVAGVGVDSRGLNSVAASVPVGRLRRGVGAAVARHGGHWWAGSTAVWRMSASGSGAEDVDVWWQHRGRWGRGQRRLRRGLSGASIQCVTVSSVWEDNLGAGIETSMFPGFPWYIRRLTDECTWIYSSVEDIFLGTGTEEYMTVTFLGTEEYKRIEEYTTLSCSDYPLCYYENLTQLSVQVTLTIYKSLTPLHYEKNQLQYRPLFNMKWTPHH
jgi:hypothetical protein